VFVIPTKYLLVKHLGHEFISCHKLNKSNYSFTQHERPRHKDHASMNACILNNPFAKFCYNKQKAIHWIKKQAMCEWDLFQNHVLHLSEISKPTLINLASSHLLTFLGIPTWGAGSVPPCDRQGGWKWEFCRIDSWGNKVTYAKALRNV
jgi:hypothetical protein